MNKEVKKHMDEERACDLARRVERTPGYRVLEVRRAWSAAVAWQVETAGRHTGERLLLLSEAQFDARLYEAGQPDTGEITTAQTTAQVAYTNERAAATSTS